MFPCKIRAKGCSQWFNNQYGMKVHFRCCPYTTTAFQKPPRSTSVIVSLKHSARRKYRLQCDQLAFGSLNDDGTTDVLPHVSDQAFIRPIVIPAAEDKEVEKDVELSKVLKLWLARLARTSSRENIETLLGIFRNPSFSLSTFNGLCKGYKDCIAEEDSQLIGGFKEMGFEKVQVTDPVTKVSCYIYMRSPVEVLRNQILGASTKSCFFDPPDLKGGDYCHPMMANLGQVGCEAISREIMHQVDENIFWHDSSSLGGPSFCGMVQVYSDKSKTSLKESAFQFYPLHITLLNFSEEYRRQCIVEGKSFVAFLPVSYFVEEVGEVKKDNEGFNRLQKLSLLHLSISTALKELKEFAYKGFSCYDMSGWQRICHPCVASYCADMPEAKDLTSVRNGNRSTRNCHRCLEVTKQFNSYSENDNRTYADTLQAITDARRLRSDGKRDDADHLMDYYSLVDQEPFLSHFPFIGIDPVLDMSAVHSFEPLHGFNLGASKQLKKCLSERLRCTNLVTASIPNSKGEKIWRTFKSITMSVLNGINKMLSCIQKYSPAKGLQVDFSSSTKDDSGNGLYDPEGNLIGMLEAKNYRSLDMVFPFVAMFVDRCCGEVREASATEIFVQYTDVLNMSMSYDRDVNWNETEVQKLEQKIKKLKNDARELFAAHQSSALCTEKFHALDHIGDDIRRMGSIRYNDAGLYEYAHTKVKSAYRSGSKRKHSAMEETIHAFAKDLNHDSSTFKSRNDCSVSADNSVSRKRKLAVVESIRTDCATLVSTGSNFKLSELAYGRATLRNIRKSNENGNKVEITKHGDIWKSLGNVVTGLISDVGEEGCRVLYSQLVATSAQLYKTSSNECIVSRVISGYVPGVRAPSASDYDTKRNAILVKEQSTRHVERIISGRGFYKNPNLRQDCVLIEAEGGPPGYRSLWVGKVLALLRIQPPNSMKSDNSEGNNEYMFVQYFDAVKSQDQIDNSLGCIRMQWARDEQHIGENNSAKNVTPVRKWFDLLEISAIRGMVHVVRGDYGLDGIGITKEPENVLWHEQHFYINRFYFDPSQKTYDADI